MVYALCVFWNNVYSAFYLLLKGVYKHTRGKEHDRYIGYSWLEWYAVQHTHTFCFLKAPFIFTDCLQGKSCYEAAKMLRDGVGTEKNTQQAEEYFQKAYSGFRRIAAENPDDKILYRIGVMTFSGTGATWIGSWVLNI